MGCCGCVEGGADTGLAFVIEDGGACSSSSSWEIVAGLLPSLVGLVIGVRTSMTVEESWDSLLSVSSLSTSHWLALSLLNWTCFGHFGNPGMAVHCSCGAVSVSLSTLVTLSVFLAALLKMSASCVRASQCSLEMWPNGPAGWGWRRVCINSHGAMMAASDDNVFGNCRCWGS